MQERGRERETRRGNDDGGNWGEEVLRAEMQSGDGNRGRELEKEKQKEEKG